MESPKTYLEACKEILCIEARPLTSRDIASIAEKRWPSLISGLTPWKTINARISAEIVKHGKDSMFMRIDRGRFALREWDHYQEFNGKRRKINPIEEDIAVLPAARFLEKIKHVKTSSIFNIDYVDLIKSSENMRRKDAEETEDFVQIVSLFLVFNGLDYLAHRRTKKLPEKRLSSSKSLNFGGHLQLSDYPSLFERDNLMVDNAIQRELREELTFTPDNKEVKYLGAIYDASTTLGRQHVGLVFLVTVGEDVTATSNEPGFLTSLDFMSPQQIEDIRGEFDSWSMRVYDYHANRN